MSQNRLLTHRLLIFMSLSEREVDAEVHRCIAAQRHKLLRDIAQRVIHAEEHIEALAGMEIKKPAERCAVGAKRHIDIGREALRGVHIGRHASLGPCEGPGNAR